MALAGKLEGEVEVHAPASKFFSLFVTELHHLQNISDHVHEAKLLQGDWHTPGSDHVKNWTVTLGDKLKGKVSSGGQGKWCPCQMDFEYEKLRPDVPPPQAYLDFVTKVTKDVDAHLIKA
ncbi:hypothetical protein K1719_035932 [Acacia pycnantha]|nr:hypothetical protein K1719_035932 [Acacia pycnantha]